MIINHIKPRLNKQQKKHDRFKNRYLKSEFQSLPFLPRGARGKGKRRLKFRLKISSLIFLILFRGCVSVAVSKLIIYLVRLARTKKSTASENVNVYLVCYVGGKIFLRRRVDSLPHEDSYPQYPGGGKNSLEGPDSIIHGVRSGKEYL